MSVLEFAGVAAVAGGLVGTLGVALRQRLDRLPVDDAGRARGAIGLW